MNSRLAKAWIVSQSTETSGDVNPGAIDEMFDYVLDGDPLEILQTLYYIAEDQSSNSRVIGMLGAGPLEDLIDRAGDTLIDTIETHVNESQNFRAAISKVWITMGLLKSENRYESLGCQLIELNDPEISHDSTTDA